MRTKTLLLFCLLILNGCVLNRDFSEEQRAYLNQQKPNKVLTKEPPEENPYIKVTYFGVSTLLFDDGENQILVDGFFSRPSLETLVFFGVDPNTSRRKKRLEDFIRDYKIHNLSAVVTVHSHHDHAMDAPLFADLTGADLIGSESTCRLANGMDLVQSRCRKLVSARARGKLPPQYGNFKIKLLKTEHTKLPPLVDSLVGVNRNIDKNFDYPARLWDYAEGGSYSILIEHPVGSVVVHANTNLGPKKLENLNVDWLFMSVARLTEIPNKQKVFDSVVKTTQAKNIVPIHWDDFFRFNENRLFPQKFCMGESFDEINLFMKMNKESTAKAYVMDFGDHIYITKPK